MHDPAPVRLVQRVGDLPADTKRLFEGERPLGQTVGERLALEKLHDEVLELALSPYVEERADVRVRELRDRLRFSLQPLARLGRRGQPRRQDLDRDLAAEPRVFGAVDLAHPAAPIGARISYGPSLVPEASVTSGTHGEDPLATSLSRTFGPRSGPLRVRDLADSPQRASFQSKI